MSGYNILCYNEMQINRIVEFDRLEVMEVKNVFHRRKRLYYANDKRNGESIIFFNVWEKVRFCWT